MRRMGWLGGLLGVALIVACGGKEANLDQRAEPAARTADGTAARTTGDRAAPPDAPAAVAAAAAPAPAREAPRTAESGGAPTQTTDRKIIHTLFLDLVVKDVQAEFQKIALIAEQSGGFVAESSLRQENNQRRASITIRVPAGRHQDVLSQIRGLATKVESERATANDITEEFTDLESRRRNLEAAEQQLLVFLGQAKTIQEVLQVQDRLNSTRAEIERIRGRQNLLNRLSELATIQIQLRPEAAPAKADVGGGPSAALRRGWEASTELLGGVALGLLTAAAFSWWLVPVVLVVAWLARRTLRRAGRPGPPPPAPEPAGGSTT
jgi:hypothetical protein